MNASPFFALALAGSLAACVLPAIAPPHVTAEAMEPVPLPDYAVGDVITWSNGATETVVAVKGEVVNWRDNKGHTFQGYRNFLLPSLAWDYPETSATTEIPIPADTMWPLHSGAEAHFRVKQRLTLKSTNSESVYHDEWYCRVEGKESVEIRLGLFDTVKSRCARYWQGSNIGEITWNYAPSLGRVVRRQWTGAKEADELVAIGAGPLDATAEKVAAKVRQHGLQNLTSGAKGVGRAAGVEASVTMRATFTTTTGAICRDFIQNVQTKLARATTAGTACRQSDGNWAIVDRVRDKPLE